jgi:hypothetical protein
LRCVQLDKLFNGSSPSGEHKSSDENDRNIHLTRSYVRDTVYPVVYPRSTYLPRLKYFTATLLRERIAPLSKSNMTSRIPILRAQIESLEQEIVRISLEEEEAIRVREEAAKALARAKAVRIPEEPYKKSVSLIDSLDTAIDVGEECMFADRCVQRSEAKVAEYEGFATMGAYEAREVLEKDIADALAVQRRWYPSVHDVLVSMRETERERVRHLEKLSLDLATLKKVIGC